jgi:hypothetical protein
LMSWLSTESTNPSRDWTEASGSHGLELMVGRRGLLLLLDPLIIVDGHLVASWTDPAAGESVLFSFVSTPVHGSSRGYLTGPSPVERMDGNDVQRKGKCKWWTQET